MNAETKVIRALGFEHSATIGFFKWLEMYGSHWTAEQLDQIADVVISEALAEEDED